LPDNIFWVATGNQPVMDHSEYYTDIFLKTVKIAFVHTDIWTQEPQNTKQECQPLGWDIEFAIVLINSLTSKPILYNLFGNL
jgi:hypothetical protein